MVGLLGSQLHRTGVALHALNEQNITVDPLNGTLLRSMAVCRHGSTTRSADQDMPASSDHRATYAPCVSSRVKGWPSGKVVTFFKLRLYVTYTRPKAVSTSDE